MNILLLSDTHGNIELINQLASRYDIDACIHCGDFCFFDSTSIKNLSVEDLSKIIRHSAFAEDAANLSGTLDRESLANFVLQHSLAGNFEDYLTGKKTFNIPVYAVWGNHDDIALVNRIRKEPIPNLTLLDEKNTVMLEKICIYGLGGDFNKKHLTMAEKLGIPWVKHQIKSSFWQYDKLIKMLDDRPPQETRIQITHCDPDEEPFLAALANRGHAALSISGHMHRKMHNIRQGNSTENFTAYALEYPSLPWQRLLRNYSQEEVTFLNLSNSKPLILEINGSGYRIKDITSNMEGLSL